MGFYCHHQYAHTQQSGRKSIPGAFKGVDLAIFSVFSALGLNVGIHPIIQNRSRDMGGLSAGKLLHGSTVPGEGDFVENYLENLAQESEDDDDEDNYPYYRGEKEGTDHRPKICKMIHLNFKRGRLYHLRRHKTPRPHIRPGLRGGRHRGESKPLYPLHRTLLILLLNPCQPVTEDWPHKKVPQIIWMNEPTHKDFAYAGLAVSLFIYFPTSLSSHQPL